MDGISLTQLLVIGVIVLILFGSKKLPEFGKSLGKSIRSFKDGINEIDADAKDVSNTQLTNNQNPQNDSTKQNSKSKTEV